MLRIVICDDEKEKISPVLNTVRRLINEKYKGEDIEIFTAKPSVLINYKITDSYTYLFILDVVYKEVSGVEIAVKLRHQFKDIYILFITESIELLYMVINQNTMPSGFLKKPADKRDLTKIVSDIIELYGESGAKNIKTITVNTGSAVYKIGHNEIIYIEALNKKVHIYTETNRISFYHSLRELENELGDGFIRCHKSFIINKSKIKNIFLSDMLVEMNNGSKIPISKTYKPFLRDIAGRGSGDQHS